MDKITLEDLKLSCIIGTLPHERISKQEIIISVYVYTDLSLAGKSDDLMKSLNYAEIYREIVDMVENSSFLLVESIAEEIAKIVLLKELACGVNVKVTKPNALEKCVVGVEIKREKARN